MVFLNGWTAKPLGLLLDSPIVIVGVLSLRIAFIAGQARIGRHLLLQRTGS